MANRITTLFDLDSKGFDSGLKKLRKSVSEADGAMGKMKVAGAGLGGILKANVGAVAASAGAALVAFGVKSVQAFQETALAAGKFADAAGIAVEDASRWMEVSGDLGIEAGAVEGAIMKMNKAAADGKPAFAEFGVEIAKTKDGVVDSSATFQNAITTIGAIEDPTLRAKAAQELFGKSYGSVAELMEMSAGELQAALNGVSSAKVIDERELRKAKEFRASMDTLKDRLEDVQLEVGGALVPALTDLATTIDTIATNGAKLNDFVAELTGRGINDWATSGAETIDGFGRALDGSNNSAERAIGFFDGLVSTIPVVGQKIADLTPDIVLLDGETRETAQASEELAAAADAAGISLGDAGARAQYYESRVAGAKLETQRAERAITDMDEALRILQGNLDDRAAWRNLKESLDELQETIADNESTWMDLGEATDQAVSATAAYIMAADHIPTEKKTELITMLDQGALDMVLLIIDDLEKGVKVPVTFTSTGMGSGQIGGMPPYPGGRDGNPRTPYPMAEGGIVMPRPGGTPAIIGEAGRPEAVIPLDRAGNMLNGMGAPITVNIYPKALPTDRELIDLINSVRRRNGNVI